MPKNSPLLVKISKDLSVMMGLPTIASWDIVGRPKNAKPGTFGFNFQTNKLEYWNGSNWLAASLSED